jgi:hypothetical protein
MVRAAVQVPPANRTQAPAIPTLPVPPVCKKVIVSPVTLPGKKPVRVAVQEVVPPMGIDVSVQETVVVVGAKVTEMSVLSELGALFASPR